MRTKEHELQDLLQFFVAAPNESLPADLDPSVELGRKSLLAAAGGVKVKVPPVVVFRVRVPARAVDRLNDWHYRYSKRAKNLLASMHLEPQPFIVEVDLRHDADIVKALLMRLTGHGTFPNVVVQGKTLGGSDDLAHLHENGELVKILGDAGVNINVG
ncbi:monothiol glutaredoxin [Ceratobasidium sp. AG-Ba]|nr:monothiol glutaredoxin [Ceratobasidium sp. AG-Ba]